MPTAKHTQWPRKRDGRLLFTDSSNAHFYAGLIFDKDLLFRELEQHVSAATKEFLTERNKENPNIRTLLQLSADTKLYREAFEEAQRLRKEG